MRLTLLWTNCLGLALLAACTPSLCLASAAAPATGAAQSPPVHHAVWHARNQVIVDGQPVPLLWAVGFADPKDLEAYANLGFNTVEIVIGAPSDQTWKAAGDLAQAAAARSMYVLISLAPPQGRLAATPGARVSPLDPAYRAAVAAYLKPIIERGATLPGVVGWVIEGVDADEVHYDRADFMHYLLGWRGSAAEISRAWETPIRDFSAVTEAFIAELDAGKPLGVGCASLDLARYRAQVYADLLDLWADEIHRLDPEHVVLAGRQHSYRCAISVPESCDGMLLGLYPGVAEDDPETHNVHGVDIARRANQFAALPVLKVSAAPSGARLAEWIAQAVLHGAAGIGFADWKDIRASEGLSRDLREALLVTSELKLCPRIVAATAAILYEPYAAGGFAGRRPLYGWLSSASTSEPGKLFRALGRGTVFGQIDYLSESSIETVSLSRYSVIIAPLALSLTPSEHAALSRYISQGGTFLADVGLGFAQSGSLERLPSDLAAIFGVSPVPGSHQGAVNLMAMAPSARFPSLQRQMGTYGGDKPASFDPPTYYVLLSNGAFPVLGQWQSAPAFAGIMARPQEQGWALYATTRLWQNWGPGNAAFDAFHRDLFGFASPIALKQSEGVVPGDDFAAFEDGSVMLLKRSREPTEILLRNPKGRVYRIWGGMEEIRSAKVSPNSALIFGRGGLQPAEPLPIEVSSDAQRLLVQMVDYSPEGVSFALYGPATQIAANQSAGVSVTPGGDATARVRIARGAYVVRPGSRHEIRIRPLAAPQGALSEVTVGRDGILTFEASANTVVTIKPATLGPAGSTRVAHSSRSAP